MTILELLLSKDFWRNQEVVIARVGIRECTSKAHWCKAEIILHSSLAMLPLTPLPWVCNHLLSHFSDSFFSINESVTHADVQLLCCHFCWNYLVYRTMFLFGYVKNILARLVVAYPRNRSERRVGSYLATAQVLSEGITITNRG